MQRGPLVYCLEQLDQPNGVALTEVAVNLAQNSSAQFHAEFDSNLLGGIMVLRHNGALLEPSATRSRLYYRYTSEPQKSRAVPLTFIPYYAWANRNATPMQVWTPVLTA